MVVTRTFLIYRSVRVTVSMENYPHRHPRSCLDCYDCSWQLLCRLPAFAIASSIILGFIDANENIFVGLQGCHIRHH